jgi:hypothetical protein
VPGQDAELLEPVQRFEVDVDELHDEHLCPTPLPVPGQDPPELEPEQVIVM